MRFLTSVLLVLFALPSLASASLVDSFQETLRAGELFIPLSLAALAGFLTSLSPCVYPLIPITLSVMGARKYESHFQGFIVALSYVFGMCALYTILGVTFASIGIVLGSLLQHPVAIITIAIIFLLMALTMLDALNLVIPESILNKMVHVGGQGPAGAFLMGLVAGVLAAPCTGPVLGFILTLIAQEKNLVLGTVLMLAFSLGMGLPFLILGTFSSAIAHMPKSGQWMSAVKYIFGAAMLGASLYYLALALPGLKIILSMFRNLGVVWVCLALMAGAAILFCHRLILSSPKTRGLALAVGASVSAMSISALLLGETDVEVIDQVNIGELTWHVIDAKTNDQKTIDRLISQAQENNQLIMLDFYADWCTACKQFEQVTFRHPDVARWLSDVTLVRIDSTSSSDYLNQLHNRFGVIGLPTLLFIGKNGDVIDDSRIIGFLAPDQFLDMVKGLAAHR